MKKSRSSRGFSLVEILVTMVIMGLVVGAVYTLHLSTQRTANTSEEVVEVQQNLRVASEWLARDLRMAGFLVDGNAIANAAAGEISLRMATSGDRIARIDAATSITAGSTTQDFTVADAEMRSQFSMGDTVRIIRPRNVSQPYNTLFTVGDLSAPLATDQLRLTFADPGALITISDGDMVVYSQGGAYPRNVRYFLDGDLDSDDPDMKVLKREDEGIAAVVANKVTGLTFGYLIADGTEQNTVPAADLVDIIGVRVRVNGATDQTKTGKASYSGVKNRGIEVLVKLRN